MVKVHKAADGKLKQQIVVGGNTFVADAPRAPSRTICSMRRSAPALRSR
jgi:hypothetical protein